MNILVTGVAGFIGMHVSKKLASLGHNFVGIDNVNDYYDVSLKNSRLNHLNNQIKNFQFIRVDIQDYSKLKDLFDKFRFDTIIHLAAQAGVRYSLKNPQIYIDSNITGFLNILELSKENNIKHLVFASSSSVYGLNENVPFSEKEDTSHPVSLYAATKKSNELMAHSYSNLYKIPVTGLRFFTVYGPWGRPDMSPHIFANAIQNNLPIKLFNYGNMIRDFTYIDDIVDGLIKVLKKPPEENKLFDNKSPDPSISSAPFKIFNIGNNSPVNINEFVKTLEECIGKNAIIEHVSMQLGDVKTTSSNNKSLFEWVGFKPKISLEQGLKNFCSWYIKYYV